jgi:MOSC domain-containing protein YiiM
VEVVSTNIGESTSLHWQGRDIQTGIFKYPVEGPLVLGPTRVKGDVISDPKHHGGHDKACYLFSADVYPYWQERYPHLPWQWGMFGENITVKGLDENDLIIGSVYSLGTALVQITLPREPCYKLGIRFGDQKILEEFIRHGHPGTYVRVLDAGHVSRGDALILQKKAQEALSVAQVYSLIYFPEKKPSLLDAAIRNEFLPERTRKKLMGHQKKGA